MNLLLCLICSAITGFCLENNVPVAEKGFEMKDYSQTFIWSDGWCLESDKAWFVDGMSNTLFCVKLHSGKCEKVGCIPESKRSIPPESILREMWQRYILYSWIWGKYMDL